MPRWNFFIHNFGFIYFNFFIISAGFNDGNSAVIQVNDQNYIPENTLRGNHVCTFIQNSYEFVEYRRFDIFSGGTTVIDQYISFLDNLDENYIIAIAVSDEGRVTSVPLKNKIKEFGIGGLCNLCIGNFFFFQFVFSKRCQSVDSRKKKLSG